MERIKCTIHYDGTWFSGYQIQPNGRTVQEELETALTKIHKGRVVKVVASGRTDAGVHAKGQVIHFDSDLHIQKENWKKALNTLLPDDILIDEVSIMNIPFHARFDVKEKEYRYFVLNTKAQDVFRRHFAYHVPYDLDIASMQQACEFVKGKHDFTSFCASHSGVKGDKVRTIYAASCEKEQGLITITFKGNGFLYNMVRILVGTLLEVGEGERKPSDLPSIIQAANRETAGKTAPPQGLFLWKVSYD
ncbi:tRNA pseudouridine(38-40) synthase TruA [Aquibacillus sp. 3ASR75-11]|uniref:tRNA pseudouridine synthase A n=1 Tax=Terrihalobacillus insolitus TaxID=2950438 RepID=A0A9X3WWP6_9BACI|nr:tRNA pseudouridine(38-40) synthase TruA [Terrihalobacillus insolitus]MDC3414609.1 tRNA pseudouridine(38-40) synthase TruA [Terrihalobacillus insolitus]MDC3425551.1 tRNA pseudouridine(38-40) synthase TruA [Terrihalobacillus insolitus]